MPIAKDLVGKYRYFYIANIEIINRAKEIKANIDRSGASGDNDRAPTMKSIQKSDDIARGLPENNLKNYIDAGDNDKYKTPNNKSRSDTDQDQTLTEVIQYIQA